MKSEWFDRYFLPVCIATLALTQVPSVVSAASISWSTSDATSTDTDVATNATIVHASHDSNTDAAGTQGSLRSLADYVRPWIGSENGRWYQTVGACRPFGLAEIVPDTEIKSRYRSSGYVYSMTN